jgi:hypothetical protein
MKGGNVWVFNDYIIKLSTKVNDVFWKKKTDATRYLWEDFDGTRERIDVARTGDHGPHLIDAARRDLGGITIHTELGQQSGNWRRVGNRRLGGDGQPSQGQRRS